MVGMDKYELVSNSHARLNYAWGEWKTTVSLFTISSKKEDERVNAAGGDTQVLAVGQLWIQDLCSSSFNAYVDLGCNLLYFCSSRLRNLHLVFELCGEGLELQTVALLCRSSLFVVLLPVIAWGVISEIWLMLAAHRPGAESSAKHLAIWVS